MEFLDSKDFLNIKPYIKDNLEGLNGDEVNRLTASLLKSEDTNDLQIILFLLENKIEFDITPLLHRILSENDEILSKCCLAVLKSKLTHDQCVQFMARVVSLLVTKMEEGIPSAFECIDAALCNYSSYCKPKYDKIHELCLDLLFNSENKSIVSLSSKVLHRLSIADTTRLSPLISKILQNATGMIQNIATMDSDIAIVLRKWDESNSCLMNLFQVEDSIFVELSKVAFRDYFASILKLRSDAKEREMFMPYIHIQVSKCIRMVSSRFNFDSNFVFVFFVKLIQTNASKKALDKILGQFELCIDHLTDFPKLDHFNELFLSLLESSNIDSTIFNVLTKMIPHLGEYRAGFDEIAIRKLINRDISLSLIGYVSSSVKYQPLSSFTSIAIKTMSALLSLPNNSLRKACQDSFVDFDMLIRPRMFSEFNLNIMPQSIQSSKRTLEMDTVPSILVPVKMPRSDEDSEEIEANEFENEFEIVDAEPDE